MNNITEHIKSRRSVRTFDDRELSKADIEKLASFANTIENPYKIPVDFKFMNAKEHGLNCPVTVGTDLFVGGKIKCTENASVAFGYSFEMFVLYAQSIGIGTTWIGGTMNRGNFERAMKLQGTEQMYCVTPLGYAADKMSLRETMMRKGVKASVRSEFGEVFFDGSFGKALTRERAGKLADPLEAVRLGPSAVNKQPWRVVLTEDAAHFYVKKVKGIPVPSMQKIDLGIALCHFALTAEDLGIATEFVILDSGMPTSADAEYIASYLLK